MELAMAPFHLTTEEQGVEASPLLLLPAELRLQIYSYLLILPDLTTTRRLTTRGHLSAYIAPPLHLCPSILQTCQQIHTEASPILYTQNVFCANPTLLTSFPFLLLSDRPVCSPNITARITRWYISVRLDTDARFTAEQVVTAFSGKESLEVEAWQAMFASSDLGVLRLFEGVRGVRHAKVSGSVGTGYKQWLEALMMSAEGTKALEWKGEGTGVADYDLWDHGNR